MGFLHKAGELIILNVIFIVCCLPVFTMGSAITSLYYSIVKCIRRDRGAPVREFFGSMKRTFGRGALYTIMIVAWYLALVFGRIYSLGLESEYGEVMAKIYIAIMILSAGLVMYIFPVLSRFQVSNKAMWKLAFVMSIRFFPITLALVGGSVLLGMLFWFEIIPIGWVIFVPAIWCLLMSFLIERALLAYMPKQEDGDDAWYYPPKKEKHDSEEKNAEKR